MKQVNIAILGCGTVGTGVARLLLENGDILRDRIGCQLNLKYVADIDTQTYDVEIGPCGEPRETLIEDASFRDDTVELSTWAVWSSQTAALEVSRTLPKVIASDGQACWQAVTTASGAMSLPASLAGCRTASMRWCNSPVSIVL